MDCDQLWASVSEQLSTIIGSDQCNPYINYLKKLPTSRAHLELSNLFDLNNDYHKKLLERLETFQECNLINNHSATTNVKADDMIHQKHIDKIESVKEINHQNRIVEGVRMECTCLAQRHQLINNCLNCGRIVCAQEGSGGCFTCGEIVCTTEERAVLNANTQKSVTLMQRLTANDNNRSFQQAINHKNILLNQDREFKNITNKVIDDQNDYFSTTNRWLSQETRELLEKQQELDRIAEEQREKPLNSLLVDFDTKNNLTLARFQSDSQNESLFLSNPYSQESPQNRPHNEMEEIVGKIISNNDFYSHSLETSQLHRDLFADPKLELDKFCSELFGDHSLLANPKPPNVIPALSTDNKFLLPECFRVQNDEDFYEF